MYHAIMATRPSGMYRLAQMSTRDAYNFADLCDTCTVYSIHDGNVLRDLRNIQITSYMRHVEHTKFRVKLLLLLLTRLRVA